MIAKWPGKCGICGKPITPGVDTYGLEKKKSFHEDCLHKKDPFSDAEASDLADRCLFIPAASIGEGFQIPAGWLLWKLHHAN